MTEPSGTEPPSVGEPRLQKRRAGPGAEAVESRVRPGLFVPWLEWVQAQPVLALAVLVFCLTAVGGLVLSLPPGFLSAGRSADQAPANAPDPVPADTGRRSPAAPADPAPGSEAAAPSSWVVKPASDPSPRGLALVY